MNLFWEPNSLKTILINGIASTAAISFNGDFVVFRSQLTVGFFGASIFLLLAVPKSEFSKVKNLSGGHVLASLKGLTCLQIF